jgi:hypothetical protein
MKRIVVERFEGEFAVVELPDRSMENVPRTLLPEETQEGDVIDIEVNQAATKEKKERIQSLLEEVWK